MLHLPETMSNPNITIAVRKTCLTSKSVFSNLYHSKHRSLAEIMNHPQKRSNKLDKEDNDVQIIVIDNKDDILSDDPPMPPMPPLPPPIELVVDPRS